MYPRLVNEIRYHTNLWSMMKYPITKTIDHIDTYFNNQIADPYRWLEDDQSQETADWIERQNAFTQDYLSQIPYREELRKRMTALCDCERIGMVFEVKDHLYIFKNDGLQNQNLLYRQPINATDETDREVFLDPNSFSKDGTTSLTAIRFSEDGSKCAYLRSEGGADWCSVHIIDTKTKQELEPPLQNIKFSQISWLENDGFFYSTYDKPEGSKLSAQTDQHKVYYHKIGTPQSSDKLYYGRNEKEKSRYVSASVSKDNKYLILSLTQSGSINALCITKISQQPAEFQFFTTFEQGSQTYFITQKHDNIIL